MVCCLLLLGIMMSFAFIQYKQSSVDRGLLLIVLLEFVLLKGKFYNLTLLIALVNAFIYLRLKYRDEGFEMVQWNEFITVHVTFPVLNAWLSYTLVYILFLNIVSLCDWNKTVN